MNKFLKLSRKERKEIITQYSSQTGINFDVIEKDIWVCYVLQKLFSNKNLEDKLIFKGGTCLSKVYHVIERFSEDIDLAIDKRFLKIVGSSERPEKIAHQTISASREFVKNFIYPELVKSFCEDLENEDWELKESENDKDTIIFTFPSASSNVFPLTFPIDLTNYEYIQRNIKIEFKAVSDIWPSKRSKVSPYISEIMPEMFANFEVEAIDIKRNFIEKLFILDSFYRRPEERVIADDKYSRHYYDVYSIIKKSDVQDLISNKDIFDSVLSDRKIYPRESWGNYNSIKSVSDLNLIPSNKRIEELKKDYKNMEVMFFRNQFADFKEILDTIRKFQLGLTN